MLALWLEWTKQKKKREFSSIHSFIHSFIHIYPFIPTQRTFEFILYTVMNIYTNRGMSKESYRLQILTPGQPSSLVKIRILVPFKKG